MRKRFGTEKTSDLDVAISRVLQDMDACGPSAEEYPDLLASVEKLIKLRRGESRQKVSPDTLAIVGGNLLGILIIVAYEHSHVVVSRGMALLLKTRT